MMNYRTRSIEGLIVTFAVEELQRLLAQPREVLVIRFEKVFGFRPARRLTRHFLAMALVRRAVDECWLYSSGCIPASWRHSGGGSNLICEASRMSDTSQDVANTC